MNSIQLSCGIWPLVEHGIEQYVKEHGRKPYALVMHPSHMRELVTVEWRNPALLNDVSIPASARFDLPVLIDERGNNFDL